MTYLTSCSGNRYLLASFLAAALLPGCAAVPTAAPGIPQAAGGILKIVSLSPDKTAPQAAEMATVRWKVVASGGVGRYNYIFWSTDGQTETGEQNGPAPTWDWSPREPGTYRVRAVVRDASGNTASSGWSSPYVVAPPLVVSSLSPDSVSPQLAGKSTVRWKVAATGGVGDLAIEFRLADGKAEMVAQRGASAFWDWSPREPGSYRVKAVVRDAVGDTADTGWSQEFAVVQKLTVSSLMPDKASPQAAGIATVGWKVDASGGVGEREYIFWSSDGLGQRAEQKGPSPTWDWSPSEPGSYRVRVVVRDAAGNTADSGWSPEFQVTLTAGTGSLIAVMPLENLAGIPVPVAELRKSVLEGLKRKGLNLLAEDELERFLDRHRVRYTGGLNRELAKAFREETGTNAVLFVSLELFDDAAPPKVSLVGRLASTQKNADILWTDGVGMAGNDAPGFLLLGLVGDPRVLWDRARDRLVDSLAGYLSGSKPEDMRRGAKKFLPKSSIGQPLKPADGKKTLSIAVLPFRNDSTRRNAGEVLALHFVRELSNAGDFEVVEPGEVRQVLLRSRTIMEGGLSLPQADVLRAALDVDMVLTGIVMEYQDYTGGFGKPKVEFSTWVFDMKTRQVVWTSSSYNEGDDSVFFFNLGKVNTAHGMASGMVRSVVEGMDALMDGRKSRQAVAAPAASR